MNSKIKYFVRGSLASLCVGCAAAAQKPSTASSSNSDMPGRTDPARMARRNDLGKPVRASELIGMKIENNEGEKIGKIDDLAVDLQAGRVVQVIVSAGGFLSMGEHYIAVPPSRLASGAAGKPLRFDITRDRLKAAPALEPAQWSEFYQSDRVKESYRYYGDEMAFESMPARNGLPAIPTTPNGLGYVQKATKLMGLPVRNLQDEKIGSVENLMVDLPSGRVVAVVVSSGGFLGIGDALSVVPPTALRFDERHERLSLDTTKEALKDAPRFKSEEWPDFSQPDYAAGVYKAYRQEPYFQRSGGMPADADNSARNARDRGNRTLTPLDQGNGADDIKISQQIRQAITAGGLSVNAQNVKIITTNGRVTLRGPVRSADEKMRIAEFAARFAGAGNVDDQLELGAR